MSRLETIEKLQGFLSGAPKTTADAPMNGWKADGVILCSDCAGRIMDRGCSIGRETTPIWDELVICEVCNNVKAPKA